MGREFMSVLMMARVRTYACEAEVAAENWRALRGLVYAGPGWFVVALFQVSLWAARWIFPAGAMIR